MKYEKWWTATSWSCSLCIQWLCYKKWDSVYESWWFQSRSFCTHLYQDCNKKKILLIENAQRDDEYVCICSDCQRVQVHHHKLYEKLMFISSENVNSFHMMIMNFITDMFSAKNSYIEKTSDAILIIIDKLIKHAIYILTIKDLNVKRLANLLWREFISHHEMMQSIILNRDSLFISYFWITLCWHLEVKQKLSIAFYLQINDQTER